MQNFLKLGGLFLALISLLTLSVPALAQTTAPTPIARDSEPPAWFKDIPAYAGVQNLAVDNATLAAVGISRAQFYVSAGTSPDTVTTITDFYVSKLEAAGWKTERQPLGPPDLAQQLTFSDPKTPGKQLIVLVAGKTALQAVPGLKTLATQVADKQTLVALAASIGAAPGGATGTENKQTLPTELIEAPPWFKTIPIYAGGKKLELDNTLFNALGASRSQFYADAVLTPDSVSKVVEFYSNTFRSRSWAAPVKNPLPKEELGQVLIYRGGSLILLVASREALNSVPTFKGLAGSVPEGQTLVVLATPVEPPPVSGTRCVAGEVCQVGAYKVKVNFDRSRFNTTDPVIATVERLDKTNTSSSWELKAQIVPSNSTSASVVTFNGDFEKGTAASRKVKLEFPIAGNWFVALAIKGEEGEAKFYITSEVDPPPLLDERLAWALGLSPILGIIGFAIGQWRLVVRRQREEAAREAETPNTNEVPDKELAGRS